MALAALGCDDPGEVELLSGSSVVYSRSLGADRLQRDHQLGVSQYANLRARVTSPRQRAELLFFPVDPEESLLSLATDPKLLASRNAWGAFSGTAVGFLHPGGQQEYPAGLSLVFANGLGARARGLYERVHGECELEVKWAKFLDLVLAGIEDSAGEADCNVFFCPDYEVSFSQRVARSYLRQSVQSPVGVPGRGGFGLHIKGETAFDSPSIDDLSFFGRALYDVVLDSGRPRFEVAGGPWAATWDCSLSPFTKCPSDDVLQKITADLNAAPEKMSKALAECMTAPIDWLVCGEAKDCAKSGVAKVLASDARDEAEARGLSDARRDQLASTLTDPGSWRCAPVAPSCASLTGAEPTDGAVCQLELRATSLVPMPDSFALVWHGEDSDSGPVTTGSALFLALEFQQAADQLADLCSPPRAAPLRPFVRRSK